MELMYIMSVPVLKKLKSSNSHLVLPHLYDTVPGYLDTYRAFSEAGDFLMQDNSLFELKEVVAGDLIDFAKRIGASEVVVPEVLRDYLGSYDLVRQFIGSKDYKSNINNYSWALVLQGKNYEDLKNYYLSAVGLIELGYINTLCIPFNFEFDAYGSCNEDYRQLGWNRLSIIDRLIKENVWNSKINHHLLGLYNPLELAMYSTMHLGIRSNDSSSCYWHSLYGVSYNLERGLMYRKIETHVDFNLEYNAVQEHLFICNRTIIDTFANNASLLFFNSKEFGNVYYDIAKKYGLGIFLGRKINIGG